MAGSPVTWLIKYCHKAMQFMTITLFGIVIILTPVIAQASDCELVKPDSKTRKFGEDRAYFKDWLVACRKDGYCSANFYLGPYYQGSYNYHWRVASPALGADYEMMFVSTNDLVGDSSAIEIIIDDNEPVILEAYADLGWYIEGRTVNEYIISQTVANGVLLKQMKEGKVMTVKYTGKDRVDYQPEFSLRGLTAALCWMAEQQKGD